MLYASKRTQLLLQLYIMLLAILQISVIFMGVGLSLFGLVMLVRTDVILGQAPKLLAMKVSRYTFNNFYDQQLNTDINETISIVSSKLIQISIYAFSNQGRVFLAIGIFMSSNSFLGFTSFTMQNFILMFGYGFVNFLLFNFIIYVMGSFDNNVAIYAQNGMMDLFNYFNGYKCQVCWEYGAVSVMVGPKISEQYSNVIALSMATFECCGYDSYINVIKRFDQSLVPLVCCKYNTSAAVCNSGELSVLHPPCKNKLLKFLLEESVMKYMLTCMIPVVIILVILSISAITISLYVMYDRQIYFFKCNKDKHDDYK